MKELNEILKESPSSRFRKTMKLRDSRSQSKECYLARQDGKVTLNHQVLSKVITDGVRELLIEKKRKNSDSNYLPKSIRQIWSHRMSRERSLLNDTKLECFEFEKS